jgi:DNA-binding response OmpR family regulator
MKPAILLVEDDLNLGFLIQEHLELCGFAVRRCLNGEEALAAFRSGPVDLCLVDVMLPKKDGFTFAREVRLADPHTPLIFLTARAMKEDRIEGFTIGADDYVPKPFSMEELVLRIQAVLKRTLRQKEAAPAHFTLGAYRFDYERQLLQGPASTQKLTAREAELLRLLCLHRNRVLDRGVALKMIWGEDSYFNGRSMDVFISRLRRRLQEDRSIAILSVHGKGFKLTAVPDTPEPETPP